MTRFDRAVLFFQIVMVSSFVLSAISLWLTYKGAYRRARQFAAAAMAAAAIGLSAVFLMTAYLGAAE